INSKTAAVMLEPIQGESGIVPFSLEFLRDLRKLCTELNVLLIFDEIQTGIGRTGKMFCFEHAEIRPDILTLGKGIGAGVPLAALVAREDICLFETGDQGGTFNGNPLMTAVGYAVVQEIARPEFLAHVRETGKYLASQLEAFGEVRGMGLLLALELGREVGSRIVDESLARGLLVNSPRPTSLRFMPALNVTRAEIDEMMGILRPLIQ
ncbi:MAG TPA: aminotransferase class III-fold pyridoxal phosphate-dependent enzyme, partial [Terriglobia bacterium]|nr:aminotransferase class III-fold pyridoxal phosphate-dependent enzyme [Terriglobia bacterium]